MPLTWFAHQVPVVGLKLARPRWFDATALCIGSMTPDVMYTYSAYLGIDTHRAPAAFVWGLPTGFVLAWLTRRVLAPVGAAQLPDAGPFRLHSFGVLSHRAPHPIATMLSVLLGIGSHIVTDWFTHPGRLGVRWLGYDDVRLNLFGINEPLAGWFQLIGHTFGSLAGVALLCLIGRRRLLEAWYGNAAVASARSWTPSATQRITFWLLTTVGCLLGTVWGWNGGRMERIERTALGVFLGAVCAAALISRLTTAPAEHRDLANEDARRLPTQSGVR